MRATATTLAALALLLLAACSEAPRETSATADTAPVDPAAEAERLNEWFEAKYEEELQFSPIAMTMQGRKDRYAEWDDTSLEAADAELAWMKASVEELESSFDREALPADAQLSWDLWVYRYERAAAAVPFREDHLIFNQMGGTHSFAPTFLINFHRVDEVADLEALVSRYAGAATAIDELLERARAAAETGTVTPRFALEGVVDQAQKVTTGAPFTTGEPSDLWADFESEVAALLEAEKLDAEGADRLRTEARIALVEEFGPAYARLVDWAEGEMADAPEVNTGVGDREGGAAYYAHRLWTQTTTDLTADEIHKIGLAEVARIRGRMEAIRERVGFEGDLQAFFDMLRESTDDPRFYFPDTDAGRQAYIDEATAAIERIEAVLPEYFGLMPEAELVVKRVEPYREQDGAAQHYYPSTPDGSRPGTYYAHLSDMTAMPKHELEVIAYHEGLPGHHMQIAIAQELEGVPTFRRQGGYTAYSEGWGLYSEWLAREMPGTYEDPYSEFGRLGSEMWRAIRLVVDTGLHAKGWTEDEAHAFFLENAAITDAQARSEVRRYLVIPGQATSYKIGMLRIQEMRARAEAALGEDFDIRAFHDVVLGGGAMPLQLLDARVDRWIEDERAG